MCGIVGILGREPVAEQMVDALKRLEYRGYDSAGVATLEGGQLDAPPRRGQAGQPREPAAKPSRSTAIPASATPAGRPTASRPRTTPIRMRPTASPSSTTASSRISASCARSSTQGRRGVRDRDRHRGRRPSRRRAADERQRAGRGGARDAEAAARRLRARLPVRRRRRPDDRRAPRRAARGRLRRGRDVSRLRRHRARALHRHDQLSRRRRLGGADAQRAPTIYDKDDARRQAREPIKHAPRPSLVDKGNHRHFMAKEIHEQPEVVGHTLAHYVDMATERVALPVKLPFDLPRLERLIDLGLRHRLLRRAASANTGSSASPGCRSRSMSPPNSATARRRCARAISAIFISQSGETADTLAALRYAKEQGAHTLAGRQRADLDHRARERDRAADAGRPGDRRRLDQGVHLPAHGAGLAGDRRRRARGELSDEDERRLVRALIEVPR